MAAYTTYKHLEKPLSVEKYNVGVANKNSDVIDSELHRLDLKNESQDDLLATKESLASETERAVSKENEILKKLNDETVRAEASEKTISDTLAGEISRAMTAENNTKNDLNAHISDKGNPHHVSRSQIGLGNVENTSDMDKPVSTAQQNAINSAVSDHNASASCHSDIRSLISDLATRLNALADSDDTTLDQLSEIVSYIKNNKTLIDSITAGKVNVSDIIDSLTSAAADKPLSAKQGKVLHDLITELTAVMENKVDKVSGKGLSSNDYTAAEKNKLSGIAAGAEVNVQSDWNVTDTASDAFIKNKPASMPASDVPAWAKAASKPAYTKNEIGLGNVENKSSAAIRGELTKENVITALGYTPPASNYTHPSTSGNKHIPSGGSAGQILRWSADGTAVWGNDNNTTYSVATTSADGLMSSEDKTKIDGITAGATKNSPSSTAPKAHGTATAGTESEYARGDHVHPAQTSVSGNAGSASKWASARNINGISVDGSADRVNYGTCSTAAATAAKTVACTGFALITGAEITVKFTVTNTAANPTLNVNSTGAKAIYYRGSAIAAGHLAANRTYSFRYNGTQYELVGDIDTNTNTNNAVTQTNTPSTNADYRVLMSATADDTTRTEGARKNTNFYYNPGTNTLTAGNVAANTQDSTVTFTSTDDVNPTGWTDISVLATSEKHSSLLNKLSTMVKNVRYLYKMLGNTDISSLGDGTVTGALSSLNTGIITRPGNQIEVAGDIVLCATGTNTLVGNFQMPFCVNSVDDYDISVASSILANTGNFTPTLTKYRNSIKIIYQSGSYTQYQARSAYLCLKITFK